MGQVVYVDLFFMINFSMDFLCFFLTAQLLSLKLGIMRTLCASALGGIYACVALFLPFSGIGEIFLDIFVCIIMCAVAFLGKGAMLSAVCVYIATSAVLGGFMTAMFSLLNKANLPLDSVGGDGLSAYALLLLAAASALVSLLGGKFFRRRTSRKYINLQIEFDGRTKTLSGFCDSGNLLCDPLSGKPCIIADRGALEGFLPHELLAENANISSLPEKIASRVRIIPAVGALGKGMLIALRTDKIITDDGKHKNQVDALLAIASLGDGADGCQTIIPTILL